MATIRGCGMRAKGACAAKAIVAVVKAHIVPTSSRLAMRFSVPIPPPPTLWRKRAQCGDRFTRHNAAVLNRSHSRASRTRASICTDYTTTDGRRRRQTRSKNRQPL